MELVELKRQNMIAIFNSILNGYKTLNEIAKNVGISKVTACDLTQILVKKNIIKFDNPKRNSVGKRPNVYSIVDIYYSMYFEEGPRSFNCISIDINGNVVDRFDFIIRKELSKLDNLKLLYKRFRQKRSFNKYCITVFGNCSDDTAKYLPKSTIKLNKEEIILSSLSESDKVILFKLNNKLVLSLYSHIHFPKQGVGEVIANKVICIDKTYIFNDALYDGLFLAMQKHSLKKLTELI